MSAFRNRYSLKVLFAIVFAIAVYLSIWSKEGEYARAVQIAEADAAGARDRSRALEQLARTWKGIALDMRVPAQTSVAHFRRWNIATSSLTTVEYAKRLDTFGIKLLTVSNTYELHVLSEFSTHGSVLKVEDFPKCGAILQGGSREQELADRAGFHRMPVDVLVLLPDAMVEELNAKELAYARIKGMTVSQIEETSFDIGQPFHNAVTPVSIRLMRARAGTPSARAGNFRAGAKVLPARAEVPQLPAMAD